MELFTSFDGRISRQSFWLGVLGIIVVSFVTVFALGMIMGLSGTIPTYTPTLISLALLYPAAAVSVKRLHDRNKPAIPWLVIFYAPGFISNIMLSFRIDYSFVNLAGEDILYPGKVAMLVSLVAMVVGIWALIELGILKGTDGENSFGPDPLA